MPLRSTRRGSRAAARVIQDVDGACIDSIAFVIPSIYAWPLPIYELALMTATRAYEMNVNLEVTL